jgi:hypothetical protein
MLSKIALEEDWRKIRKVNHYVRSFRGITGHIGANATLWSSWDLIKKGARTVQQRKDWHCEFPCWSDLSQTVEI